MCKIGSLVRAAASMRQYWVRRLPPRRCACFILPTCSKSSPVAQKASTGDFKTQAIHARPKCKQFRSYPCIKIGRFAVSLNYRDKNIGSDLMDMIKDFLYNEQSRSAFRFITVDAYLSAIPFYEKNGFKLLSLVHDRRSKI